MNMTQKPLPNSSFTLLREIARGRKQVERCEFCSAELSQEHQHLIEPARRRLICICLPCAILFSDTGETAYRRVPRRILSLPDFRLTDAQWEGLQIPIQLAFFFHSSPAGRMVALYPSPGGPIEALLDLTAWEEIVEHNPLLQRILPDVEGLLVNRVGHVEYGGCGGHLESRDEEPEYYLAPIDEYFKLAGLIRVNWHGLSGGEEVWKEIDQFFADLKTRASLVRESLRA
jgi:hypothetical protein